LGLCLLLVSSPLIVFQSSKCKTIFNQGNSGDSYSETGFNLNGTKPSASNQLGNPAFPGLTTSGGPNWVGDLAKFNSQLLIYNFASGGATINASLVALTVIGATSFIDQVAEFMSNLVPPLDFAPWVSNSTLFAIWVRNTDVVLAWNQSDWSTLCQQLIDSYFQQVQLLYSAGARNFVFAEVPPLERTPAMLQQSVAAQQSLNSAIGVFNGLLNSETSLVNTLMDGQEYSPSPVGFA
jgi:phospholipase/lecithinase/hemolysin